MCAAQPHWASCELLPIKSHLWHCYFLSLSFFQWCASGSWIQASIRVLWVSVHWLSLGLVKFVNCIEGCHVFMGGRGAVNYSLSLEMQKTAEARERCYVGHFLLSHPLNRQSEGEGERESDRQSKRELNCSITMELRLGSPQEEYWWQEALAKTAALSVCIYFSLEPVATFKAKSNWSGSTFLFPWYSHARALFLMQQSQELD